MRWVVEFEPKTFLLWGNIANHRTTLVLFNSIWFIQQQITTAAALRHFALWGKDPTIIQQYTQRWLKNQFLSCLGTCVQKCISDLTVTDKTFKNLYICEGLDIHSALEKEEKEWSVHTSPFPELGNSSTEGFDVQPAVFTRNTKVKASARYESSTADDSD